VTKPSIESAFIQKEDLVLDPSLGGIHLTKETVDRESLATVVAYVVKKGLLCYSDKEKYGETPWCEEGDWVLIGRYAGARFKLDDGDEVRIINDDEVIGTILNPDDIVSSWR
jgi:co-chaperonin GroES (HSP10)